MIIEWLFWWLWTKMRWWIWWGIGLIGCILLGGCVQVLIVSSLWLVIAPCLNCYSTPVHNQPASHPPLSLSLIPSPHSPLIPKTSSSFSDTIGNGHRQIIQFIDMCAHGMSLFVIKFMARWGSRFMVGWLLVCIGIIGLVIGWMIGMVMKVRGAGFMMLQLVGCCCCAFFILRDWIFLLFYL